MIKDICFTKKWIDDFRKLREFRRINPPILEKMIYALYLLQHLVEAKLNFVFKGGTSLIIILENANRFSVDIDIISKHTRVEIEAILDEVVKNSNFIEWTLDERRSYLEGVPKAHYELAYTSGLGKTTNYILLDILFEDSHYPVVQSIPITSPWIISEKEIFVNTPTPESILGDKLTAFAPNTTGIRYGVRKEQEIIKQLFDIGYLFDVVEDLKVVNDSFQAFATQEIAYRKLEVSSDDVLDDIIKTSKLLSKRGRNEDKEDMSKFVELTTGLRRFRGFTISGAFPIDKAVAASAKTALIGIKLKTNDNTPITKYNKQDISNLIVEDQNWNFLNRLKRLPDKSAFFYWHEVYRIIATTSL